MPRKVRELRAELRRTGYVIDPKRGKGSHTYWTYLGLPETVTISGKDGDDAQPYQEKAVRRAIEAAKQLQRQRKGQRQP